MPQSIEVFNHIGVLYDKTFVPKVMSILLLSARITECCDQTRLMPGLRVIGNIVFDIATQRDKTNIASAAAAGDVDFAGVAVAPRKTTTCRAFRCFSCRRHNLRATCDRGQFSTPL